jgi:hypothetical protein
MCSGVAEAALCACREAHNTGWPIISRFAAVVSTSATIRRCLPFLARAC